jgi:hypothetical protein
MTWEFSSYTFELSPCTPSSLQVLSLVTRSSLNNMFYFVMTGFPHAVLSCT